MSDANRLLFLRIALIVIGLTFIFGIYTLGILWPSGWTWGHGHSHYLLMIIGVYATLGTGPTRTALRSSTDPGRYPQSRKLHNPGTNVRYWHKADMPSCTAHVRFWG